MRTTYVEPLLDPEEALPAVDEAEQPVKALRGQGLL